MLRLSLWNTYAHWIHIMLFIYRREMQRVEWRQLREILGLLRILFWNWTRVNILGKSKTPSNTLTILFVLTRSETSTLVADDAVVTRDSVLTSRDRQSVMMTMAYPCYCYYFRKSVKSLRQSKYYSQTRLRWVQSDISWDMDTMYWHRAMATTLK